MGKVLSCLDENCICGMSSRCPVHTGDTRPGKVEIRAKFYICQQHIKGLEINHAGVKESTFYDSKDPLCNIAGCHKHAYAVFALTLEGEYQQ